MKALFEQAKFPGKYEEDLEVTLLVFGKLAQMCGTNRADMRKLMPVLLSGKAMTLFEKRANTGRTYQVGKDILRSW